MYRPKIPVLLAFCLSLASGGLPGTAFSEERIELNHYRVFAAEASEKEFLMINLVTPRRTRVQIVVTQHDKILEQHRLVIGPAGVCEGQGRGARWWGYPLGEEDAASDLDVTVFVQPLAGNGTPVTYMLKAMSDGDEPGFRRFAAVESPAR